MITRFNPPFGSQVPPQCRGACAAVAGGGPNRATAIVVARLVFTISGQSRAFTALRLIDLVTAVHSHLNELATLEFGLQQLARLEDELAPDGAVPGPLMLTLSSRTRVGTVERANAIAAATLSAEAQRRCRPPTAFSLKLHRWRVQAQCAGDRLKRSQGSSLQRSFSCL